jgi:hypothetical protein
MNGTQKKYSIFNIQPCLSASRYSIIILLSLFSLQANAQKDTEKKQTIDITSSYKPVLRNAVKINFSASHLNTDTTRPKLQYNVPSQNLFYSYQPISLKPLALQQDTNLYLGLRNFLKVGYGNFSTPYVSAGFSFGDGKKMLFNLYANYISSKGKIVNQDYAQIQIKANGSFFTPKNEVYVGAQVSQNSNYLYGYNHSIYNFKRDSIRHQFNDIALTAGIRNTTRGEYGISYNPNITVINFTNKDRATESSIIANAPVTKTFGEAFMLKVEGKADITSYSTKSFTNNIKINNNVFQIAPSLILSSPRFSINGGIIPTWNNGTFVWLPNVYAEAQLKEKIFLVQAGWIGRVTKNTYRNLTAQNPFLTTIAAQNNTKEIEYYGGIKATVGKHFSFNLKGGIVSYKDLPFFINDTATDIKAFKISNEKSVQSLRIHGDVNFINQDKFTLTAGLTFNGYTLMQTNARAWHTIPTEITSSLRWWAFKQVLFKADLYSFSGSNYLTKGNIAVPLKGGTDISAGVEFRVNKMFSAWLDVNNIANQKYERWHNYEVLGLNVLGGIRVNF